MCVFVFVCNYGYLQRPKEAGVTGAWEPHCVRMMGTKLWAPEKNSKCS